MPKQMHTALGCITAFLAGAIGLTPPIVVSADTPITPEVKHVDDFSAAVRCMDDLFLDYGIHNIAVLTEDFKDKQFNDTAKAELDATLSAMSRRSHAFRVIAYSANRGNLISFLSAAQIGPAPTESGSSADNTDDSQPANDNAETATSQPSTASAPPGTGSAKTGTQQSPAATPQHMDSKAESQPTSAAAAPEEDNTGNTDTDVTPSPNLYSFGVIPQFDIAGSILLETLSNAKTSTAGNNTGSYTDSELELFVSVDLNIVGGLDFSLTPGNTSSNDAWIGKNAQEAWVQKGKLIEYRLPYGGSKGVNSVMRSLLQLSSIELAGRLTKVPYWSCLGITGDAPEIIQEETDWYYNLRADNRVVAYFQTQLGYRQFYKGSVDNVYNRDLITAIKQYQQALGLPASGDISFALFKTLLNRPIPKTQEKLSTVQQPLTVAIKQ